MGRITKLRDLIGVIKDKVSLSKATLVSNSNTLSIHLAVLRTTTHSPSIPPDDNHLATLLSLGYGSRATASALVASLMDRLHRTSDSSVALKCLVTIHHIIKRGPFMLQDQLSVFPASGGHNYLKLSAFRDGANFATVLGFFLCSSSGAIDKDKQDEGVSSFTNVDLIGDTDSMVGVMEEICKVPDSLHVDGNKLLQEIMGLVGGDFLAAVNEISLRLSEFNERRDCLSFGESVELMCALKRLEECKERLMGLFSIKKVSTERCGVQLES
ncbi:hypothetical protein F0562_003181 [Nyssa sinensis]|uniref:ENTH domain-containing protein n=1 Tax=Nyssa sinensis TaxID=561372 RepID=A0A5J5BYP2_9ASTE|nr:hypothetical protein F0562_003181 [Nyssa sinensis]